MDADGANGHGGADGDAVAQRRAHLLASQLSRVIAGCAQLLRLRGRLGQEEEQALKTMSARGSDVLLAAVEAYGASQDLEVCWVINPRCAPDAGLQATRVRELLLRKSP